VLEHAAISLAASKAAKTFTAEWVRAAGRTIVNVEASLVCAASDFYSTGCEYASRPFAPCPGRLS
jgi:hypothetical protein